MSVDSVLEAPRVFRPRSRREQTRRVGAWLTRRPELFCLLALAGVLNLWGLSINGWANTYYSAAVHSMSTSWHDFLFASLDRSGLMTVDKPPLSLWVEVLSTRVFGFHPLALLIPEAVMGMAAVVLLYDLVRRRFGRGGGFAAGLVLATTPTVVAVSRHNNPDELLALCAVAALWFAVRALETGRTRWLVLSGAAVGLGFETKMGVALMVVPGIAAAWMWVAPPGRLRALGQLAAGGAAMLSVGGAWPLLVALTPAADRPWISGTSDNSILSLIFGYNGIGRVAGQSGGPRAAGGAAAPGGGGTMFGGPTGVFRLLHSGLGDQAGWLLGFALVAGAGILLTTRLRRQDPRTGWLVAVGGAFLTTAVVFSFAQGIFHPYYVSLLAPFTAALVGGGVGVMLGHDRAARILAPLAILGGTVTELVVLGELRGQLAWARPVIVVLGLGAAAVVVLRLGRVQRLAAISLGVAALVLAPSVWAAETLGHATSGTFPTGGPASAAIDGPGGPGAFGRRARFGFGGPGGPPPGGAGSAAGPPGFALPGAGTRAGPGAGAPPVIGGLAPGVPPGATPGAGGFGGGPGGFGANSSSLRAAIRYAEAHGGGTIGVSSQSTAAAAIISDDADVAGLGGFSGRESSVGVRWLAEEVRAGHLRWVIVDQGGGGLPGDTRAGSRTAMSAVAKACRAVSLGGSAQKVYDCAGRSTALSKA